MTGRSSSQFRSLSRSSLSLMMIVIMLATTACNRTTPRKHWWQFWKPKATAVDTVYQPDRMVLPPPPGSLDGPGGVSTALPPPPTAQTAEGLPQPEAIRSPTQAVSELSTVYFQYDSSELSAEAQQMLDQNAQWLSNRPTFQVSIEGHCDERGTEDYNMNLGQRRAKMVRDYLVTRGVGAERLHMMSFGENRPVDPAPSEEAFAKNRRVQFLVY